MAWISNNTYLTEKQMQNNVLIIYEYLAPRGWSVNAIAGMLGNMEAESTINPGRWQSGDEGNYSVGFGLVQWTPASNYTNWATSNGYSITDGYGQLKWIDEETVNKGQWIKTSAYNISFNEFKKSTASPEYLAMAFLKNFERAGVEVAEKRQTCARKWYDYLGSSSVNGTNYYIIEKAIEFCVNIANDDSHGYDQTNRWGPDYDCSSLLIAGFEQAGCPVKTNGATNTRNMKEVFAKCGFETYTYSSNMEFVRGDVLWRTGHTEMYIGNGQRVGAHINENGETTGGKTGDQTGKEISVANFSTSENWETVLRLPQSGSPIIPVFKRKKRKGFNFVLFGQR